LLYTNNKKELLAYYGSVLIFKIQITNQTALI